MPFGNEMLQYSAETRKRRLVPNLVGELDAIAADGWTLLISSVHTRSIRT